MATPPLGRDETGDMLAAHAAGVTFDDKIVALADAVRGLRVVRQTRDNITMFKSVGCGLQDIAVAELCYLKARETGAGALLAIRAQSRAHEADLDFGQARLETHGAGECRVVVAVGRVGQDDGAVAEAGDLRADVHADEAVGTDGGGYFEDDADVLAHDVHLGAVQQPLDVEVGDEMIAVPEHLTSRGENYVLKVRGDYLAVATLGLGEIVRVIVISVAAAPLLAGSKGILQIPRPAIGSFDLDTPVALFYLTLAASLVAAYFAWRLEDSRLGRAWMAIRDDEDVAQALGINLINVKLLAYGLGAAFAGLAGSIFAVMLGSIYPHSFQLIISINILALTIVGGMGSLPGVVLGAAVLIGLPEMLREFGEFRYLFYGLAIIAVMRLKPEGLWPSAARRREMALDAETAAAQAASVREQKA